ncbi:hypothetical protein AcW1_005486 [Taiwanofungus camphoratus]|nr:hypothetical protein AcW2_004251 [Antrodia cinnamomea]KAI0933738.1 hypothetical protein AcV5_005808 [Antrodia cinnamomea]KAI0948468.1 hypothetical protein AcV7_009204 [Antrodia cinnamomea]KAI0956929.1 hypothetical protein AcW1_005486 [Antrodia cinnamomea]
MYGRNRAFLITLCVIYSFVLVSETTIISLIVHDPRFIELPVAMFTGCLPTNLKPYAWTFWLPMLTFEGIIFFLSLWRVVRIAREGIKTPDLVIALARDSVIYFGGVLIAILINVIVWKTASEALFVAFLPIAIASFSIFGSRLLLNMQAAAEPSYRLHYLVTSGLTAYTGALESHPLPSIEFGDLSSGGESSNADA